MKVMELSNVRKSFDGESEVLKDISIGVEKGEVVAVIGPSGSGKSTLLRCATLLTEMDGGGLSYSGEKAAWIGENGKTVYARDLKSIRSRFGLVFQNFNLFPHYTVLKNLTDAPVSVGGRSKAEAEATAWGLLAKMGLSDKADCYPCQLSGGQQQRVAIARAIVSQPKLLLLDEPLSNLDAKLRIDMRGELKRLHQELGTTVVYVTHDQVEALTMSTRIAVFFDGVLAQIDTPTNIYSNPASVKIADFIGNPKINFIEAKGEAQSGVLTTKSDVGTLAFERGYHGPEGKLDCLLGIRPEQLEIVEDSPVHGIIKNCQPAGSETLIQVQVGDAQLLLKCIGLTEHLPGQQVSLSLRPESINVFDKASGALIKDSFVTTLRRNQ